MNIPFPPEIQRLKSLQDLNRLIELDYDKQLWKHLCNDILEAAQADRSSDHDMEEHYSPWG